MWGVDLLDSREQATALWLVVLFGFVLTMPKGRSSFGAVGRALLKWKVLVPFLLYFAYISIAVWLAWKTVLWNGDLLKETVLWTGLSGVPLFVGLMTKREYKDFTKRVFRDVFAISVALTFFVNLRPLAFPLELILQPVVASCAMTSVVAAQSSQSAAAKKFFDVVLVVIVVAMLVNTGVAVAREWDTSLLSDLTRELALNFWLPVAAIPFIYTCALVAQYELALMRMRFAIDRKPIGLRSKIGLFLGLRLDLQSVASLHGRRARELASADSLRACIRAAHAHKRDLAAAAQNESVATARLHRFAGVEGTNPDGTRLDQREFAETKRALHWIATCQMGWYRNRGHYIPNMLEILGDLSRHGLQGEHGIVHVVSDDGQAWWAWRRTITGWVFAIGANAPPPNEWLYDGPDPPKGIPGQDPMWGTSPFMSTGPNW